MVSSSLGGRETSWSNSWIYICTISRDDRNSRKGCIESDGIGGARGSYCEARSSVDVSSLVDRAPNDAQILFTARRKILARGAQFDIASNIQRGCRRDGADAG